MQQVAIEALASELPSPVLHTQEKYKKFNVGFLPISFSHYISQLEPESWHQVSDAIQLLSWTELCLPPLPNSYVKTLTPSTSDVTVFGDIFY